MDFEHEYDRMDDDIEEEMDRGEEAEPLDDTPKPPKLLRSIFEWMEALVASLIVVVLVFTFVFRIVSVEGDSMNMTLVDQDRVLVTNILYQPKRGDVVVITNATSNNVPIIKRVIGIGGDTIRIDYDTNEVFVNDSAALQENYIFEPMLPVNDGAREFTAEVPDGHVFVLGDNRNRSDDSRFADVGMVDVQLVMGKAFFRILPMSGFGQINSPDLDEFVENGAAQTE